MSSLTSKEVRGLMEAYQNVYAPQEITEEQVWEQVEEWVNGLLDEGYDLSDYTWEEMYEAYIEEQGGIAPSVSRLRAGGPGRPEAPKPAPSMSYSQRMGMRRAVRNMGSSRRPQVSNIPPSEGTGKPGPGRLGNIPPAEGTGRGGPSDIKAKPSGTVPAATAGAAAGTAAASRPSGSAPAPTAKPPGGSAAPASTGKPATAAAAPAAPAAGTKAAGPESIKPKTPNPLLAGGELARMRAASMMRQQGRNLPSGKVPTSADLAPKASTPAGSPFTGANAAAAKTAVTAATSPKPAATTAAPAASTSTANPFKGSAATTAVKAVTTPPKKPAPIAAHTDLFDLVKGYLLDEGYADTEESAIAIMSSMSEEWKNKILENY